MLFTCQRVTKGRRNEVKVSKSSVAVQFDKLEFTILFQFESIALERTLVHVFLLL